MKRIAFFLLVLAAASGISNAQERNITRGAAEGELYMKVGWYINYGVWGDEMYLAILHVTENGKKLEMNHSMEYLYFGPEIGDSQPMQSAHIMADATSGVLYNVDHYEAFADDGLPYLYTRLWFSNDYGKTWVLRDKQIGQNRYYISNFEGLIYRGGGGYIKV
ncbi:MAG: hypothetical protein LBU83_09815, partial [Bacteroidales bacterium]|nr:hypothetical protein [Bacteroidales bacterium]